MDKLAAKNKESVSTSTGVRAPTSLARNTMWMTAGQVARIGVQAGYFVVIAHALGVELYGAFVSVAALAGALAPFSSWGIGNVMIKNVAQNPASFPTYWGRVLRTTLFSGAMLALIGFVCARFLLPSAVPSAVIALVLASDLVFSRIVDMSSQAFQSFHELGKTAGSALILTVSRTAGALLLVSAYSGGNTAMAWSLLYLIGAALSAAACAIWVSREHGSPSFKAPLPRHEMKEGFHFALTQCSQTVYNDIDKVLLARLATLEVAGAYAAAYRILDALWIPVRATLWSAYARFFQVGATGARSAARFAAKLSLRGGLYGLGVAAALLLGSSLIPRVLGRDFATTVPIVQLLSGLIVLRTLHYFGGDALTGAGHQPKRSVIQAAAALFNVALNLALIPSYGWKGAVASTLITETLLALVLWTALFRLILREARATANASASVSYGATLSETQSQLF